MATEWSVGTVWDGGIRVGGKLGSRRYEKEIWEVSLGGVDVGDGDNH